MKKLNLACGKRYHEDWINIDFEADSSSVKKVNILKGIPFKDNSLDIVYSSHFLEHLSLEQMEFVLSEIKRVLKPNGIVRITVPDLENICREYLDILSSVKKDSSFDDKYNWIAIEMLDQLVRMNAAGDMGKFFENVVTTNDKEIADYILKRTGDDLLVKQKPYKRKISINKIKNKLLSIYLKFVRLLIPSSLRDILFVNTAIGEKHLWMYDEYSLTKKLEKVGFQRIIKQEYNTSLIENFNSYALDIKDDGKPYKGESSLYLEAIK